MMATAPEEAVHPTRDVPLGIGLSVVFCTILYLLMALVISGDQQLQGLPPGASKMLLFQG